MALLSADLDLRCKVPQYQPDTERDRVKKGEASSSWLRLCILIHMIGLVCSSHPYEE